MCENAFRHEILHYSGGVDGFVAGTLPFVAGALAAHQPVLVAARADRSASLREALGCDGQRVHFVDMASLGRNPGRIISAWHDFLADHCDQSSHALGIGEPVWPGRNQAELAECERHEALLNLAFDGGAPWLLLCPYDVDGLDDHVVEAAQRTHPYVAGAPHDRPNPHYHRYIDSSSPFEGMLPDPSSPAHQHSFQGSADLSATRHLVSEWARQQRLQDERTDSLVLAVNEIATNSVLYGGGGGSLRLWREQETLLCEISDRGRFHEPLVGRKRPNPTAPSGRGLWLTHQLCDLVQVRNSPSGSSVRIHMQLAG